MLTIDIQIRWRYEVGKDIVCDQYDMLCAYLGPAYHNPPGGIALSKQCANIVKELPGQRLDEM